MLTIQPLHGLCNRMRAVDSAVSLSRVINLSVRLVWSLDRKLGCPFDPLFEVPAEIVEVRTIDRLSVAGRARARLRRLLGAELMPDFRQQDMSALARQRYDFAGLKGVPAVHIETWDRFYPSEHPFAALQPVVRIQHEIERTVGTFGRTFGVHVRRTDHGHARRKSPIGSFVDRIDAAIAADEADSFFVATDDPGEEDLLRQTFPGRILSYPKRSLDRASPEAIQDALVDLYCLASTTRLLASYWSTFSETAAQINAIPANVVTVDRS